MFSCNPYRKKNLFILLFFGSCILSGHLWADEEPIKQQNQNQSNQYSSIKQTKKKAKWKTVSKLLVGIIIATFISLVIILYWKIKFAYPPTDLHKCIRTFYLYKIEKKGEPIISYLHGVIHIRSAEYVVPKRIKDLSPSIHRLVIEINLNEDQDLKVYRNKFFNTILEKYDTSQYEAIRPYIQQIQAYKSEDKLQFLYSKNPWLSIKYDGKGKYTERELYRFFDGQEKGGLETSRELAALREVDNPDCEKLAEKAATNLWNELEAYALDSHVRQNRLNQANNIDETIPTNEKQLINWKTRARTYKRNVTWFPKIERMIEEKSNLFAVGSAHINGLLLLFLSKEEYTITRMWENGREEVVTLQNYNDPFV